VASCEKESAILSSRKIYGGFAACIELSG